MKSPFRIKTVDEKALESLVKTHYIPSFGAFELDLSQEECALESAGFSPEFTAKFHDFCRILRGLYDAAIHGDLEWNAHLKWNISVGGTDEPPFIKVSRLPYIGYAHLLVHGDNLPSNEIYKLLSPRYVMTRAIKELVKDSFIGEAIRKFGKGQPLLRGPQESHYQMEVPGIDDWLSDIPPEGRSNISWLKMSDTGEDDYYAVANDILRHETQLLTVLRGRDTILNLPLSRANLIEPAMRIPATYSGKFKLAQRKLQKYGAESIDRYFVRGEVGENGRDGQLALFGPNAPKGTMYYR